MSAAEAILFTMVTAATPLLLAALGELVAERAGVLNLGVEGMMAVGAATGFAAAILSDSSLVGALVGIGAGALLSLVFAALVLGLGANQVACGLALTLVGLGVSGLIGAPYVGARREAPARLDLPVLDDLPLIGRAVFGQDMFVHASLLLLVAVAFGLSSTRAGLVLRAVGEDQASAHALGLPVRGVRLAAILFGGACAGLAGAYLTLAYTPFWSPGMTAGRGWIALALVVFAGWRPWLALLGALVFGGASVLQLHAQAAGLGLPSQALAAVPYLATLLALVLLALRGRGGRGAPGSLGQPFVPER